MSEIHALSGASAVSALDDGERNQFERHLAQCPACSSEVESLREAASLLAETTISAPSAELRTRVLAGIVNVRPLPPLLEPAGAVAQSRRAPGHHRAETSEPFEDVASSDTDSTAGPTPGSANVIALAPRRRRRLTSLLAAAAAVVAIGVGVAVQQAGTGPDNRTDQVLQASDAQRFSVALEGGGTATVVRSNNLNEAVLVTKGIQSAPSGSQYVLWLKHDGTLTPAGVMPSGSNSSVVFSGDAVSADGAAVSVEDEDAAPTEPSDDVVADFNFTT